MLKSLKVLQSPLSSSDNQLAILEDQQGNRHPLFKDKVAGLGMFPLRATSIEIFQVNAGKMCNQVCKHCHVDAGPDRKEIMTRETMQLCLDVLAASDIKTVDITGGAPELNPDFRWFVEEIKNLANTLLCAATSLSYWQTNVSMTCLIFLSSTASKWCHRYQALHPREQTGSGVTGFLTIL